MATADFILEAGITAVPKVTLTVPQGSLLGQSGSSRDA